MPPYFSPALILRLLRRQPLMLSPPDAAMLMPPPASFDAAYCFATFPSRRRHCCRYAAYYAAAPEITAYAQRN